MAGHMRGKAVYIGLFKRDAVRSISLHWTAPLTPGGVCMLMFPLWAYGARGAAESSGLAARPHRLVSTTRPRVATLFLFGGCTVSEPKADRPKIAVFYLVVAHVCLAVALAVMAFAVARILT